MKKLISVIFWLVVVFTGLRAQVDYIINPRTGKFDAVRSESWVENKIRENTNGDSLILGTVQLPVKKIVYFGNSITSQGQYTKPLSLFMNVIEINKGIAGSTLAGFSSRYSEIPVVNADSLEKVYSFITLDYGINDVGASINITNFGNNLRAAINAILAKGWTKRRIVLITPNYVGSKLPKFTIELPKLVDTIINIAKQTGVRYTETYSYTKNNGGLALLNSDSVHINATGGIVMARSIFRSLTGGGELSSGLSLNGGLNAKTIVNADQGYYLNNLPYVTNPGSSTAYNFRAGTYALYNLTTGTHNTSVGWYNLVNSKTSSYNIALGEDVGRHGQFNSCVLLGFQVGYGYANKGLNQIGQIKIGYYAGRNDTISNRLFIENSASQTPLIGGKFDLDQLGINMPIGNAWDATLNIGGKVRATDQYLYSGDSTGMYGKVLATGEWVLNQIKARSSNLDFSDTVIIINDALAPGIPITREFEIPTTGIYNVELSFFYATNALVNTAGKVDGYINHTENPTANLFVAALDLPANAGNIESASKHGYSYLRTFNTGDIVYCTLEGSWIPTSGNLSIIAYFHITRIK